MPLPSTAHLQTQHTQKMNAESRPTRSARDELQERQRHCSGNESMRWRHSQRAAGRTLVRGCRPVRLRTHTVHAIEMYTAYMSNVSRHALIRASLASRNSLSTLSHLDSLTLSHLDTLSHLNTLSSRHFSHLDTLSHLDSLISTLSLISTQTQIAHLGTMLSSASPALPHLRQREHTFTHGAASVALPCRPPARQTCSARERRRNAPPHRVQEHLRRGGGGLDRLRLDAKRVK